MKKNWGVGLFFLSGFFSILGAIREIGSLHGQPHSVEFFGVNQNLKAGIITILGSLAYLSAKQRNGSVKSAPRIIFEFIAIIWILWFFSKPTIWDEILYFPFQSLIIPAIALLFYFVRIIVDFYRMKKT